MLNKYVENKLKVKIKTHLKLAGFDTNIDISKLVEKVKELGDYKIIWKENLPVDIVKFDFPHRVEVESGKYLIFNTGNRFNKQFEQKLYSSEFIDFTIKEMREYKLNKILKV
jgi:hypothetical protein